MFLCFGLVKHFQTINVVITCSVRQYRLRKKRQQVQKGRKKRRVSYLVKKRETSTLKGVDKCNPKFVSASLNALTGIKLDVPKEIVSQVRQRVHETYQTLKRFNARSKLVMLQTLFKRYINSPSCKVFARSIGLGKDYRLGEASTISKSTSKCMRLYFRIRKFRDKRLFKRHQKCVQEFIKHYGVRGGARILNLRHTEVSRQISFLASRRNAVSCQNKFDAFNYFSQQNVTMMLPYKKYGKNLYMRGSLSAAYADYAAEQRKEKCRVLSFTSVYRSIRKFVRPSYKIPFRTCQCIICTNSGLIVDGLVVAGVKGISKRLTVNLIRSYCQVNSSTDNCSSINVINSNKTSRKKLPFSDGKEADKLAITDYNRECIFRKCSKCGLEKFKKEIKEENVDFDFGKIVGWHQWKQINKPYKKKDGSEGIRKITDKVAFHGTAEELLQCLMVSLCGLSYHMFHFRWQAFQYEESKNQLREGDVLMVMDFAQNYSHIHQDAVQSSHFGDTVQTTLHPIVLYYLCPNLCSVGYRLIREEIVIISPDKKHDNWAVKAFLNKAIEHCKEKNIQIDRIILWTDNCSSQYKSKYVFDDLSHMEIPVLKNFFCSNHGKADADGAIGRLAQYILEMLKTSTAFIATSEQLYRLLYEKRRLQPDGPDDKMCLHYRREYYYIDNIDRPEEIVNLKTVVGTQLFHCVRNTGTTGMVELRESSCFCEPCFHNEKGSCKNSRLVREFKWAFLPSNDAVPLETIRDGRFQNTLWDASSLRYIPQKNPCKVYKKKITKRQVTKRKRKILPRAMSSTDSECEDDSGDEITVAAEEVLKIQMSGCANGAKRTHPKGNALDVVCTTPFERISDSDWDFEVPLKTLQNATRVGTKQRRQSNRLRNYPLDDQDQRQKSRTSDLGTPSAKPGGSDIWMDLQRQNNSFNWDHLIREMWNCKTFEALSKLTCKSLPPLPTQFAGHSFLGHDKRDTNAQKLIPNDVNEKFKLHCPIEIIPDGNCFFRCLSRLVYGTQEHFNEMRCRIVIDSISNMNDYLNNDYLMRSAKHGHIKKNKCPPVNAVNIASFYCVYALGAEKTRDRDVHETGIRSVYQEMIMNIRKDKQHASVWQFHSAANVLQSKLLAVHPTINVSTKVRGDHNRMFLPKNKNTEKFFAVMWTGFLQTHSFRPNTYVYNHFVPLIKVNLISLNVIMVILIFIITW